MAKTKARRVLSVRRCNPEYYWFYLSVDGMATLIVHDEMVVWKIDEEIDKAVAYVQRVYHEPDANHSKRHLRLKKVTIVGSEKQIRMLQYNLGEGINSQFIRPYWDKGKEDF